MHHTGAYVSIAFCWKVEQLPFIQEKKFKTLILHKKALKLNTKIKTACIFRIHIYKIVNEFSMCFSCR